jgi:hypothetical protein
MRALLLAVLVDEGLDDQLRALDDVLVGEDDLDVCLGVHLKNGKHLRLAALVLAPFDLEVLDVL